MGIQTDMGWNRNWIAHAVLQLPPAVLSAPWAAWGVNNIVHFQSLRICVMEPKLGADSCSQAMGTLASRHRNGQSLLKTAEENSRYLLEPGIWHAQVWNKAWLWDFPASFMPQQVSQRDTSPKGSWLRHRHGEGDGGTFGIWGPTATSMQ